jgi:excisionase family DNA binding protein
MVSCECREECHCTGRLQSEPALDRCACSSLCGSPAPRVRTLRISCDIAAIMQCRREVGHVDRSWLSVRDAAEQLELSVSYVRSLLEAGSLQGEKLGHVWFIDPEDVRRRSAHEHRPGRPLSASNAWRYLLVLSEAAARGADLGPVDLYGLDAVERSRLRAQLADIPQVDGLARLVRSRANVWRMRVHPGALDRLLVDGLVSAGAGRAVAVQGGGVAEGGRPRLYVREADVDSLRRKYRLADDVEGNVDVAVIPASVAEDALPRRGEAVPLAAAWADLFDDPDARARHAAHEWVANLPRALEVVDGRKRRA